MCFNAQSLRNKLSELLATVTAKDPEIIGITESWGDEKNSDAEFSIPGYGMYRSDHKSGHRGGGVLLYVKAELNAVQVTFNSQFTDQIWYKINIASGNELSIGVCYCSPTAAICGNDNNSVLCHLLKEVQGRTLLMMGDFNFPDIDWLTSSGQTTVSQNFVDAMEDGYLKQHVREPTRKD